MSDLLEGVEGEVAMQKLCKADFHGCLLRVTHSKASTFIGLSGIVVKETKETFQIVTKMNRLKKIPKRHSWFAFDFKGIEYTLYGNQFKGRSGERMTKKFKSPPTIQL